MKKSKFISALLASTITLLLVLFMLPSSTQAAPPGCEGLSTPDAIENCTANYIQREISRRCTGMSVDAYERCAITTRETLEAGNYDYSGPTQSDPSEFKSDCEELDYDNCGIVRYLVEFINILTAIVGIVIVAMIIVGGVQYSAAGDNPQAVQAAKGKITNALLALVVFIFTSAFLQWIVPGGVL